MVWNFYIISALAAIAIILIYAIVIFNRLVRNRSLVKEAFSGIDVQLKKRHNLVPALVQVAKGYMNHEKEVLVELADARSAAMNAQSLSDRQVSETDLMTKLNQYFMVVEQYPNLKASGNFKQLHLQLVEIEDDIEKSRRYFNATVRDNNIAVQSFPSLIIAKIFIFKNHEFFNIEKPTHRLNPTVDIE